MYWFLITKLYCTFYCYGPAGQDLNVLGALFCRKLSAAFIYFTALSLSKTRNFLIFIILIDYRYSTRITSIAIYRSERVSIIFGAHNFYYQVDPHRNNIRNVRRGIQ